MKKPPQIKITLLFMLCTIEIKTRMWADARRDGRPAKYRWRLLQKFHNSVPCTTPQSLADAHCLSAV